MKALLILPVLIPIATAALSLLLFRRSKAQRLAGLVGTVSLLGAAMALVRTVWRDGIQAVQIGNWQAPFGITFVADLFSAIMVLVTAVIGVTVATYSVASVGKARESFNYYPLFNILLAGVSGAFLTGDIFNLYVWFEVMLIASFVLMALGGERPQMQGALKYVTINLVSSAVFLSGVGILYGVTGTLNMAELAVRLEQLDRPWLVTALAMVFLVTFGLKAAVFPFFFWLPASYHTPAVAVSALFAGLLTKVGVYALIRVFTLIFVRDVEYTHRIILVIGGLTMITGVLGAMAQGEMRRILSFHIISQIGYMIMGLGLFTKASLAASIFYIVHHIIVKTNLFLVSGVVCELRGTYDLKKLGGLYTQHPLLALLFIIPAFSLAGMPPLSGFFAKLSLIKSALEVQEFAITAVALFVGLLTLYSMIKIWNAAFWGTVPPGAGVPPSVPLLQPSGLNMRLLLAPIVVLAGLTVLIGVGVGPAFAVATVASEQLMDRSQYIAAVLGDKR